MFFTSTFRKKAQVAANAAQQQQVPQLAAAPQVRLITLLKTHFVLLLRNQYRCQNNKSMT